MSIRQIRLSTLDKIRKHVGAYQGKKVNFVLVNKTSLYCELISVESDGVVVMNQRLKKVTLPWSEISELYFDQVV